MSEEEFCRELNEAISGGVSKRDIAERFGVHESTLEIWCTRAPHAESFRELVVKWLRELIREKKVNQ